jgi:alkane 1-monooxygenase
MNATAGPAAFSFFTIYLVAGSGFLVGLKGGFYTLLAPIVTTFVMVPIADVLLGVDTRNPAEKPRGRAALAAFRLATWLAIPAQAGMLVWAASRAIRPDVPAVEVLGAIASVGVTGGAIGITVAHELIHRPSRVDRALGGLLLVMVSYLHWAIEHVAGHHRRVATADDPATARLGESLPAFLFRSVVGGYRSAWAIERGRGLRLGIRSPLRNRVLFCSLASCALAAVLGFLLGPRAILLFFAQSAVAIAFLETVNYIEHYGLERRLIRPGTYERVAERHSWNASHRLTNALLFNLQRHSDHHVWPLRPYHELRHQEQSPQLPMGYAGMALLAMVPPLWRRVMDPRVMAHRERLPLGTSEGRPPTP